MLANSLTPAKPASIFDLAQPTQTGGEQAAGSIDFAALLPSVAATTAPASAVVAKGADLPGAASSHPTLPEFKLIDVAQPAHPRLAGTGKILPLAIAALPQFAGEAPLAPSETAQTVESGPSVQDGEMAIADATTSADLNVAALPAVAVPPLDASQQAQETEIDAKAPRAFEPAQSRAPEQRAASNEAAPNLSPDRPAKPISTPAIAIQVAATPDRSATSEPAPVVRNAEQASRIVQPQPAGGFSGQDAAPGDERPAAGGGTRSAVRAGDLPRFAPMADAPAANMPAALAASAEAPADGTQITPARFAAEAPAMRELSRIVETLASAREASGTQTATLALDHAEFGALSLRFDQRADGLLSVQLSAADADAQQALATAVAERPVAAPGEAGAATSQNQSQSQAGSQSSHSSSQRGAATDREGQAAGHETSREHRGERQRGETRGDDAGQRGQHRSGIYA